MTEIFDIEDQRISFYKSLRYTPLLHIKENVFIAEGEKVVLRLLRSALKIHSIFAILDFYERYKELIEYKMIPDDNKYYASKKLMEEIVGFHLHSGVMAIGYKPTNAKLDDLSVQIIALNKVNNSENTGQISRICRAFGFDSLIVDEHSTSPFLRRAVRVSMGNVFYLKIRETDKMLLDLDYLKNNDYRVISCELTSNSTSIYDFEFGEKNVLVFGNEDQGVSKEILNISDSVVEVPIQKDVDSLNVATAVAVVLSEYNRKKRYRDVAY